MGYNQEITVSGSLTTNGTTFIDGGASANITVNSGGDLTGSASTIGVPLDLTSGSTDNLQYVAFNTQLTINSGATINITSDDFTNGTVVASGNANATISLINNFWGTINPTQIAAKITGHANNANLPYVTYDPFLSENATATYASNASLIYSPNAQTVTLSASAISADGPLNAGTVAFTILNGSTKVGTPVTANVVNGMASGVYTIPAGTFGGVYTIQAVFSGTSTLSGSSDSGHTLTINEAATTTAASSATATLDASNQTISLSATVTSAAGIVNEGTETFTILSGTTTVGTPATANVSNGAVTANYTVPGGTPIGTYTIQAVYNGTVDYATSTDTSQSLTINASSLTDFWTGASAAQGGNDNWSNPGNWALGAPPTMADTAYFTASESQYGTSTVDTAFSIANLTIDSTWGGSIVVNGSLTISGNLILAAGTLGGNGMISVAGSGSQFSAGILDGSVTNSGTLTISGSSETLGGTLTNTGTVDVTGATTIDVASYNGATIDNQAGATFDFQAGATLSDYSIANGFGTPYVALNNAGTLEMTAPSGATTIDYPLDDTSGTVTNTSSGTLNLVGGATLNGTTLSNAPSGTFNLEEGGTINGTLTVGGAISLTGGTFTASDGSAIVPPSGGTGALQVTGATLSLGGTVSTGSMVALDGGALTGPGTLALGSQVIWTSGLLGDALTNAGTIIAIGTGSMTLDGTLTNTGTIDVTGATTIDVASYDGATIDNQAGATFDFQAGATLSDYSIANGFGTPYVALNNAGTLEMTAPSGATTIDYPLDDTSGTVTNTSSGTLNLVGGATLNGTTLSNAPSGTFNLEEGGTINGTLTVGGAISLTGGTFTASDGSAIFPPSGGTGALQVTGATLSLGGTVSTGSMVALDGGALTGPGTLALGSQVIWTSGLLGDALTNAGTIIAIGTGSMTLDGTLTNTGTIDVTGATTIDVASYDGATIDNQAGATFDFQAGATLSNYSIANGFGTPYVAFNNSGTLEMTAPSGTATIDYSLNNTGGTVEALGGTLSIPDSGVSSGTLGAGTWVVGANSTLTLNANVSTLPSTVILQGSGSNFTGLSSLTSITTTGTLELENGATFTISGDLDNAGTIDLAAGTLNVPGNYTQESTGTYAVGIGGVTPGSLYGQLNVTMSTTLNGDLNVSLLDGYTPPEGDSYQVLTFASETSNFSAEFGLYFGGGEGFRPTFVPSSNPTALDLDVVSENAETSTTVTSSENPSNYGDSVTFTATVTPTVSTDLAPTGEVDFYDGSTEIGSGTLTNGSTTFTIAILEDGPNSIVSRSTTETRTSVAATRQPSPRPSIPAAARSRFSPRRTRRSMATRSCSQPPSRP